MPEPPSLAPFCPMHPISPSFRILLHFLSPHFPPFSPFPLRLPPFSHFLGSSGQLDCVRRTYRPAYRGWCFQRGFFVRENFNAGSFRMQSRILLREISHPHAVSLILARLELPC